MTGYKPIESGKKATKDPTFSVQIVEVIKIVVSVGKGTPDEPLRLVEQYWNTDGKLLCVKDPYIEGESAVLNSSIHAGRMVFW